MQCLKKIKTNSIQRLTAPYLFVLGVVEVSMKWFNYNSVFEPPTMDHVNCPKYWWRNILYINTLFPVEEMVIPQFPLFSRMHIMNKNGHSLNHSPTEIFTV